MDFFCLYNWIRIAALVTFLVTTHSSIDTGMYFISITLVAQRLGLQTNEYLTLKICLSITANF